MPDTDLLALPEDVRGWSDEHVLIALAAGAPMRCCYCAAEHYPRLAAMTGEPIGSSAGGEQPKFAVRVEGQGVLIGNTDMHTGNLSFLHNGPHPLELAPDYDMLPMALASNRQGNMRDSIPCPVQNSWVTPEIWAEMEAVAQGYWARVGWGKTDTI